MSAPIAIRAYSLPDDLGDALCASPLLENVDAPIVLRSEVDGDGDVDRDDCIAVVALREEAPDRAAVDALVRSRSERFLETIVLAESGGHSDADRLASLRNDYVHVLRLPCPVEELVRLARDLCREAAERRDFIAETHDRESAVGRLVQGVFELRTMEQARNLSTMLSRSCPCPDDAAVGMLELMANAVEHGNLGIGHDEKADLIREGRLAGEIERRLSRRPYAGRLATVSFAVTEAGVRFTVSDEGEGFDYRRYLDDDAPAATGPNGRGIRLARVISFDSLDYADGGRTAVAVIRFPPSAD